MYSRYNLTISKTITMSAFLHAYQSETERIVRSHPMFPFQGTPLEQETFITKYTNSLMKIRAMNKQAACEKEKKGTKRISELVQDVVPKKVVPSVCQAINLNNVRCKFKATCGRFCKKHQISANDLELV